MCSIPEKMTHHHLDDLFVAIRMFRSLMGELPGLWKADVDAAFRRLPIKAEHRWAASVAFRLDGEVSLFLYCISSLCDVLL